MKNTEHLHIVLGITGGIAAYKSLSLIRLFKKAGHEVRVVVTKNALQFVTPLTLSTLSQNPFYSDCFEQNESFSVEHISLADWADVMIVAPASANILGKFANGIADDALSTLLLAMKKPIFVAPAMNTNMYENAAVQRNIETLKSQNVRFIEPEIGFLACGIEGNGRMAEPELIFEKIINFSSQKKKWLSKNALVTAGPTFEAIDPVRFIGNHSSGLMGFSLAEELANQGANVTLISGPSSLILKNKNITRIDVISAQEMLDATLKVFPNVDLTIMAAAVADFRPLETTEKKIKKKDNLFTLELIKTTDILQKLGKLKTKNQCVVGFALETENEEANALSKLACKNADFIVLNSLNNKGSGFKSMTNQVTIFSKTGEIYKSDLKPKSEIAKEILDFIS